MKKLITILFCMFIAVAAFSAEPKEYNRAVPGLHILQVTPTPTPTPSPTPRAYKPQPYIPFVFQVDADYFWQLRSRAYNNGNLKSLFTLYGNKEAAAYFRGKEEAYWDAFDMALVQGRDGF